MADTLVTIFAGFAFTGDYNGAIKFFGVVFGPLCGFIQEEARFAHPWDRAKEHLNELGCKQIGNDVVPVGDLYEASSK